MATPNTDPSNTPSETDTDSTGALRGAAVVLLRVLQGGLIATAVVLVVGSLLANQSVLAFLVILAVAGACTLGFFVLEVMARWFK
jgi:hypothetical protein